MQTGNLRIKQPISPAAVTAGRSAATAMVVVENFAIFYGSNVRLMLGFFEISLYSKHQTESNVLPLSSLLFNLKYLLGCYLPDSTEMPMRRLTLLCFGLIRYSQNYLKGF